MARAFGRPAGLMGKRVRIKAWSDEPMTVREAIDALQAANPFITVGAKDSPYADQVAIGDAQVFIMADYAD